MTKTEDAGAALAAAGDELCRLLAKTIESGVHPDLKRNAIATWYSAQMHFLNAHHAPEMTVTLRIDPDSIKTAIKVAVDAIAEMKAELEADDPTRGL